MKIQMPSGVLSVWDCAPRHSTGIANTLTLLPAYNRVAMARTKEVPKEGDKCPWCKEGVLTVSSSGLNLVCPKCGRIVILHGSIVQCRADRRFHPVEHELLSRPARSNGPPTEAIRHTSKRQRIAEERCAEHLKDRVRCVASADYIKRAICHEAGHAAVALHLGFLVQRIEVVNGLPECLVDLDNPAKTGEQKYTVLAGGLASEQLLCGGYDQEACRDDEQKASERGGQAIEDYLPKALTIIKANQARLRMLRKKLTGRWIEENAASGFDAGSFSFELMSREELERLWRMPS